MKETLKLAHEELKHIKTWCLRSIGIGLVNENVLTKVEEALAQPEQESCTRVECMGSKGCIGNCWNKKQPEQEPVASVEYISCCTDKTCSKCKASIKPELVCVCGAVWEGQELIYTPPQRTWVGLTDEEELQLASLMNKSRHWLVAAVEAKLKEKNL